MTKSKGVGRGKGGGGARPGAGRPRKLGAAVVEKVKAAPRTEAEQIKDANQKSGLVAAEALGFELGWGQDEVRALLGKDGAPVRQAVPGPPPKPDEENPAPENARSLVGLALATLQQIMWRGPQDGPRVAAAREVLRRSELEAAAAGEGTGKKAQAKANAHAKVAAGGKFAPPPPPPGSFGRPN